MFTGLIQTIGQIRSVSQNGNYRRLAIVPNEMFEELKVGESIALSGVCLTVISFDRNSFTADASQETTSTTTLGSFLSGQRVNLERALRADDRLGGHFVSGHIDQALKVRQVKKLGKSVLLKIELPERFASLVVDKGSVTLDGVSLTIVEIGKDNFAVNLIPETQSSTTLIHLKKNNVVNVEFDVIGKYILRWQGQSRNDDTKMLSFDKLRKNGF